MAHLMKYEGSQPEAEDFLWPDDLLKPDLVIFLQVSEQERMRRHMNRKDFTNTQEEQTLAKNEAFRQWYVLDVIQDLILNTINMLCC